jgi:hypothetical protein
MLTFAELIETHFYTPETNIYFEYARLEFSSMKKFAIFNDYINNIFLTNEQKSEMLDIFYKVQKLVHAVIRLKKSWSFKKARLYNTDDLFMTPISMTDKNVLVLVQNKMKYVFHIRELLQSIQTSLSNCTHYFPDPNVCKNPYTNIPFNKSALYNIYFAIRRSDYKIPELLQRFFRQNFNFNKFSMQNEELINDEYLNSYVSNHCFNIYGLCREMFYNNHMRFTIHKDFPKDLLMKAMKPYLTLFVFSQYSLNHHKKTHAQRILHCKLHRFTDYNPNFGRRKVRLVSSNPFSNARQCKYFFEENYLPFYDPDENFMGSHIEIVERRPPIQLRLAPIVHRGPHRVPTPVLPDSDTDEDEDENDEEQEETNDDRYHNRFHNRVVIDDEDENDEDNSDTESNENQEDEDNSEND